MLNNVIHAAVDAEVKYIILLTGWTHKDPVEMSIACSRY